MRHTTNQTKTDIRLVSDIRPCQRHRHAQKHGVTVFRTEIGVRGKDRVEPNPARQIAFAGAAVDFINKGLHTLF